MRQQGLRTKEARLAVVLAFVVVVVRLWLGRRLAFCGTPDACYYLGMAQNLAAGQGFHARFLFDLQQAHLALPNTGIEYWRPGISLVLALLKPFGGVTLHSSVALTVLVGVLYAGSAWHLAMRAYGDRRLALGSFALTLLSSPAWTGSLTADSGLYYGAAVAWFLALFTVGWQGVIADVIALGCVCLAYMVRNDAVLLLAPMLAVLWGRYRSAGKSDGAGSAGRGKRSSIAYAAVMIVGFFSALAPMHLLYRAVLGTAFPGGTAQALYLNDLSDFLLYRQPVNVHTLLAHGVKHLVVFRLVTLFTVVYRIGALMIGYAALVFLPGLFLGERNGGTAAGVRNPVQQRQWPELTGALVFLVTILFVYSMVMPAIGGFSALRSAVGVMPLISVLVMVGIVRVARTPRVAVALASAVLIANTVSGFMDDRRDVPAMNKIGDVDRDEAKGLALMGATPANAVVLTNDPVQFSVTTGYSAVGMPINGLDAIAEVARDLHVTHVMLDTEALPAPSDELSRQLHPLRSAVLPTEHTLILELPHEPQGE